VSINLENHGFPLSKEIQNIFLDKSLFFGRSVRNAATISLKSEKLKGNFPETM
jgi:hypothetical protein